MFGHNGQILRVDLSSGDIRAESYGEKFARAFLGGNGFAAKLIYDGVEPKTAFDAFTSLAILFALRTSHSL